MHILKFNISDEDGETLVKLARRAVTKFLSDGQRLVISSELQKKFNFNSGIFVTLNNSLGLRGCIGFPLPNKKISEGIVDAAIAAATEDPRFVKVSTDELGEIVFEVTILSPPEEILVSDPLEYLTKIRVGRDGLIITSRYNSGLLLPQVPIEYGWNEEQFLGYTCEKAGLPNDYWKKGDVKIEKFEGVVFQEETPNGIIEKKRI